MSNKPKILVFDIETLPIEALVWGLHDQNISIDMVKKDFSICTMCAKFVGEPRIYKFSNFDKYDIRDDKALVKDIVSLLKSADVLVSQNGISFDAKKIASRAWFNNLKPYELPGKHVDLLREGRRVFGHTSHKLAWITRKLESSHQKSEHAKFPGIKLWLEVMAKNPAARKEMVDYCAQDVLATEEMYKDYITWFPQVDLRPFYEGGHTADCRACGSNKVVRNGTVRRKAGRFQTLMCSDCGCTTTLSGQKNNLDKPLKK